jgi:primosomal protein N' (replication factor Y) (superfamily II helicase)
LLLPDIEVVNLKEETHRKQMKSIFSSKLLQEMSVALAKKEQVILFQNRRGFSLRVQCDNCGYTPQCVNCDVTLIYHKQANHLRCHYCGYTTRIPDHCPSCNYTGLLMKGFGTEKIEEELGIFFPEARIARMDLDSTRSKAAHQHIIGEFEEGRIDFLVGTQMVTKGLDFDNVSLVGILNADSLINYPDFRSFERAFQLMEQVSGRAGRKNKQGKVLIQAWNPAHPVIQFVIRHDYTGMYNSQFVERQQFKYPPFYRLIALSLRHMDFDLLNKGASEMAKMLRNKFGNRVLGPEYPQVSRIKNLYIKNILIKLEKTLSTGSAKQDIEAIISAFVSGQPYKSIRVIIDVDPV